MRISRSILNRIILEEREKFLLEGGCGGNIEGIESLPEIEPSPDTAFNDYDTMFDNHAEIHGGHAEDHFMNKDEALRSVVAIAMVTSCPMTREALLSLVEELVQ